MAGEITHILDGGNYLKIPKRLFDISILVLSLSNGNLTQCVWFMVLKNLRKLNSVKMNLTYYYITIVAYRYHTPVFWFPLRGKLLNHDPTELTARKQGAACDEWATQD